MFLMVSVRASGEKREKEKKSESLRQWPIGPAICSVKALSANGTDQKTVWDVRKGRGKSFFRTSPPPIVYSDLPINILYLFYNFHLSSFKEPIFSLSFILDIRSHVQILSFIRYWWISFLGNPKHQHSSCQK